MKEATHYRFTGTLIEICAPCGAVIATIAAAYFNYYPYFNYLADQENF